MFYSLTGTLTFTDSASAAIDCGGVAFSCNTTINTLKKLGPLGSKVTLYTYLSVKEDALDLFGFYEKAELDCFKLLIGVNGVGPKASLSVLSELDPHKLALCIATGDHKEITRAQGIGSKTAQRIVLELRDKLAANAPAGMDTTELQAANEAAYHGNAAQASAALVMLGYSQSEAAQSVGKLSVDMSVEDMIKASLKDLSGQGD
jgi:Holliday junction DNA helicase RuvA